MRKYLKNTLVIVPRKEKKENAKNATLQMLGMYVPLALYYTDRQH